MNSSSDIFIALMRSVLWNKPLSASFHSNEVKWNEVWAIAMQQSMWALVTEAINKLPAEQQPPPKELMRMNHMLIRNRQMHEKLNATLVDVVKVLNGNGITPILLKGQGVATYYNAPSLRCCGDIDLFIGIQNYEKACQAVRQWGEDYGVESTETEKHYHFQHNGVTVELHRIVEKLPRASQNRRFQRWTDEMLMPDKCRRLQFDNTEVLVPPADFEVLYFFNHAYHHFLTSGIGLRQICDWTLALHHFHDSTDLKALEHNLNDFGLMRGWKIFGCIATSVLGLPVAEFPFYDASQQSNAESVLSHIYKGGNFGIHDPARAKRPDGYVTGKWHTFRNMHRRFASLLPIFPSEIAFTWMAYLKTGILQVIKDKITER